MSHGWLPVACVKKAFALTRARVFTVRQWRFAAVVSSSRPLRVRFVRARGVRLGLHDCAGRASAAGRRVEPSCRREVQHGAARACRWRARRFARGLRQVRRLGGHLPWDGGVTSRHSPRCFEDDVSSVLRRRPMAPAGFMLCPYLAPATCLCIFQHNVIVNVLFFLNVVSVPGCHHEHGCRRCGAAAFDS